MTNTTNNRPNKYAAPCCACGLIVVPGEGHLVRKEGTRWLVGHAPCPGMVEVAAVAASDRCPVHPANRVGEHNDGICTDCEYDAIAAYEARGRRGYAVLEFPAGSYNGGL